MSIALSDKEFEKIKDYIYNNYGINFTRKKTLVEGRLINVVKSKGFKSFNDYFDMVFQDRSGVEMETLLNCLTTNHTYFMREREHFDFLRSKVLPEVEKSQAASKSIKIWSAGCSSGQEAYTLAMTMSEYFGANAKSWDRRILATDISENAMEKARKATYDLSEMVDIPKDWQNKYLHIDKSVNKFTVDPALSRSVIYRPLNLMEAFSFKNKRPFDVIFCRNVMIYFDQKTKEDLVRRFYDITAPGGYLFIGQSENINRNATKYNFISTGIMQK